MARKKKLDFSDIATARKKLNLNQKDFWTRYGVTQSGGSRYESGRNIPKPLAILLWLHQSGKVSDKEALTKAIAKAQFPSVRGNFRYANNHFPVQNFYLRSIGKNAEGRVTNKTIRTVLENYGDAYAAQCKLK